MFDIIFIVRVSIFRDFTRHKIYLSQNMMPKKKENDALALFSLLELDVNLSFNFHTTYESEY